LPAASLTPAAPAAPRPPATAPDPRARPASRPCGEADLIAQVLDGPEPAAEVMRWAESLARVPFWERRSLGAAGLVREHAVPPGAAARLAALWELAERWFPDARPEIASPRDAVLLFAGLAGTHSETVMVLLLDGRQRPIDVEVVAVGSTNVARLQPRDVLAPAMRRDASAIVVAHSHPAGDATPSRSDRHLTMALREAAALMGVPLLDHIVVARRAWHSFAREEQWTDTPTWAADDRDGVY